MFEFEPFLDDHDQDHNSIQAFMRGGIELDTLELDCTLPDDLLPELRAALLFKRRTYRRPEWWQTSEIEEFEGYPEFISASHRASWLIEQSCRAYLDMVGGDANSAVFEDRGEMVSMNDLLDAASDDHTRIPQRYVEDGRKDV